MRVEQAFLLMRKCSPFTSLCFFLEYLRWKCIKRGSDFALEDNLTLFLIVENIPPGNHLPHTLEY